MFVSLSTFGWNKPSVQFNLIELDVTILWLYMPLFPQWLFTVLLNESVSLSRLLLPYLAMLTKMKNNSCICYLWFGSRSLCPCYTRPPTPATEKQTNMTSWAEVKKNKISPFISSFSVPGLFDQVLQTLNSLHSGLVVAQWKPEPSQRPPASSSVLILLLHHGCLLHLRGTTQRINIITSQTLRKCHFQLHSVN